MKTFSAIVSILAFVLISMWLVISGYILVRQAIVRLIEERKLK